MFIVDGCFIFVAFPMIPSAKPESQSLLNRLERAWVQGRKSIALGIPWIEIYPVDSVIRLFNNWRQEAMDSPST